MNALLNIALSILPLYLIGLYTALKHSYTRPQITLLLLTTHFGWVFGSVNLSLLSLSPLAYIDAVYLIAPQVIIFLYGLRNIFSKKLNLLWGSAVIFMVLSHETLSVITIGLSTLLGIVSFYLISNSHLLEKMQNDVNYLSKGSKPELILPLIFYALMRCTIPTTLKLMNIEESMLYHCDVFFGFVYWAWFLIVPLLHIQAPSIVLKIWQDYTLIFFISGAYFYGVLAGNSLLAFQSTSYCITSWICCACLLVNIYRHNSESMRAE